MDDVKEKLVEILNKVQDTGVVEIPAGFGTTHDLVKNEFVASQLIANGVTVQEWEPANCKPHSYGMFVVAMRMTDGEMMSGFAIYNDDGSWTPEIYGAEVTHWMDFPQPPKGE